MERQTQEVVEPEVFLEYRDFFKALFSKTHYAWPISLSFLLIVGL